MAQIDLSRTKEGSYILENANYEFINFNNINPNCYIRFKHCNIDIIDDINTKHMKFNYIFEDCNITLRYLNITFNCDERDDYILRMFSRCKIQCNKLTVNIGNVNFITKDILECMITIKANHSEWLIGSARKEVIRNPYINIVQKITDYIYYKNIVFSTNTNNRSIAANNVFVNCNGEIYVDNNIGVRGSSPNMIVASESTIYATDIEDLSIRCDDTFNIFMKDPAEFRKVKYEGIIGRTNCGVNVFSKNIYKFKVFFNVDFTNSDKIQQFYNCKFYNCFFNDKQLVLNSALNSCKLEASNRCEDNFVDCIIT